MLASTCSIRFCSLARVKFLSGVHRLELAAVNRRYRMGEKVQSPTHLDKPPACRADRWTVVLPEVGDGLEVRREPSGQPHQLDIAASLSLEPPTRSNLVDIAVNVDLQQDARMIRRTPRRCRRDPVKSKRREVQLVNERLDDPDLVLLGDKVVQILRKQNALSPILTRDKALHHELRLNPPGF
jgi:hypothetical protein